LYFWKAGFPAVITLKDMFDKNINFFNIFSDIESMLLMLFKIINIKRRNYE